MNDREQSSIITRAILVQQQQDGRYMVALDERDLSPIEFWTSAAPGADAWPALRGAVNMATKLGFDNIVHPSAGTLKTGFVAVSGGEPTSNTLHGFMLVELSTHADRCDSRLRWRLLEEFNHEGDLVPPTGPLVHTFHPVVWRALLEPLTQRRNVVRLNLSPEAKAKLDELVVRAKVGGYAEATRNALRLYDWHLTQMENGRQVLVREGDKLTELELIF